jgi:hypothetical protein
VIVVETAEICFFARRFGNQTDPAFAQLVVTALSLVENWFGKVRELWPIGIAVSNQFSSTTVLSRSPLFYVVFAHSLLM